MSGDPRVEVGMTAKWMPVSNPRDLVMGGADCGNPGMRGETGLKFRPVEFRTTPPP